MTGWEYIQPVKLVFGSGATRKLAQTIEQLGLENGLLVCDPIFDQNGMAQEILKRSGGRLTGIFSAVTPNPSVDSVDACCNQIRAQQAGFVAALGGGSSLDCAKAACLISQTPYKTEEFHNGSRKLPTDGALRLLAIPTTAGTGSEVTPVAVLSNPCTGFKAPLVSDCFYPVCAVVDPELTLSVPPNVTASTGMDVLAHALEGFWSKNHQPICDALALHAASLAFAYLPCVYRNENDRKAREKMSEASLLAGLAFSLPKTAGVHACSFPLTSIYHIPHGEACAFTLDAFTEVNAEAEGGRLHGFAQKLGFEDAYAMARRIKAMKREMGMKMTLADAGIPEERLEELCRLSMHPNMGNNPVEMDPARLRALYLGLTR